VFSLILPTFNEAASITQLLDGLDAVLRDVPHEIIVVDDDSPDGTWKIATTISKRLPSVRVIRRTGKRGLSSAVTDGFDAAHGDILGVMDADGQHDASILHRMLDQLKQHDLVVGSRYIEGGSVGDWVADRRIISGLGTFVAKSLSRTSVSDPLSGFFMMRASLYEKIRQKLKPSGFKILLEILANVPRGTRTAEVPLVFRMRLHGASKLSMRIHGEFAWQVLRLSAVRMGLIGHWIFTVVCMLSLLVLVPRAWHLKLLYINPQVRESVQSSLTVTAAKNGWLLSDIALTSVTQDTVVFIYHPHLRSMWFSLSCTLTLSDHSIACDE
jgi:dolichol-phosphate mannosyltransferase